MARIKFLFKAILPAVTLAFFSTGLLAQNGYSTDGTVSWETGDSKDLAAEYRNREDIGLEDHVMYESKIRMFYEWDETEDRPKAEEEGEVTVLALTDYVHYYDGLFQDDDIRVDYAYGVTSANSSYGLEAFKRSYESSSIFHQDGEFISFRLPDNECTSGEVMKYKYQSTYTDLKYLTKVYLQKSKFTRKGTYEVWVPSWMQTEIKGYHLEEYDITVEVEENVKWEELFERDDRANTTYTVYTYSFENLSERESEYASPGSTHYMPHLLFLNKRYDYRGNRDNIFSDLEDLYGWYHSLTKDLETEPNSEIKEIVDELLVDAKTEEEKLKLIFYWIQDNIRYIAFEDGLAGFKPENADFVCANRYGDCKGMANLAKVMLTYSGFDARLTWLGTNHIAHSYDVPTLSVDNHMICTIFLNGKTYFIDPTEEYVALGEYATRIQGRNVLIENGDSFLIKTVPEAEAYSNRVVRKKQMVIDGNILKGKATEEHHGESKLTVIRGYNLLQTQDKEDAITSFLNDDNKNLNVLNITAPDFEDRESIVQFSYDYEVHNNVISYDNVLMFQPDFEQEFYYFVFNTRKTPYQFGNKYYIESEVEIEIPDGYEINHLPESQELKMDDFTFKLDFKVENNKVVYTKKIVFESTMITTAQFEQWNQMIAKLQGTYDDYVILKKKG